MEARSTLTVLVLLLTGTAIQAGLYNTREPFTSRVPPSFPQLREILQDLRAAAASDVPDNLQDPRSLRAQIQRKIAEMEKQGGDDWTLEDRANLAAFHIRLGQFQKAIDVLMPVANTRQPHFQVLANLATAYELSGFPERALSYREQALAAWPRLWPGWTEQQLKWNWRVEKLHWTLLNLRQQERLRPSAEASQGVDLLFPKVRFTGPQGIYTAGEIAWDQTREIPEEAIALVSQLLLGMPHDDRLYWLLGELYNAHGNIQTAADILEELSKKKTYIAPRELRHHLAVLEEARPTVAVWRRNATPKVKGELLWQVAPRGCTLAPGLSEAAQQASCFMAITTLETKKQQQVSQQSPQQQPQSSVGSRFLPDWKTLGVGFVAGAVVGLLLTLQVREFYRRFRRGETASTGRSSSTHN